LSRLAFSDEARYIHLMPDRNRSNSPWDPQPGRNQHDMPPPKRRRPYWLWLLVAATATAALLYLLSWQFPGVLSDGDTQPYLAHHVILLVVLGSALMAGRRTASAGSMVRYAAIWIVIGVVAILGYSYRADFKNMQNRVIGELRPDLALTTGSGDIAIRRSGDGHFRLTAVVDGKSIRFLVDTGASLIALTRHDAQSLGFDTERLTYGLRLSTANGTAWAAGVSLGEVVVGSIRARNVNASVSRDGLPESLLGLTFLNRLSGYEVRGDTMILKR
jgi:aspartyl protease family protein